MASYLLDSEVDFTRMEGDDSDVEITISNDLDITGASCKFEIQNRDKEVLISKESSNVAHVVITGQTIKVILSPTDTDGRSGVHRYEFKLVTATNKTYRICRGDFCILPKIVD